MKALRSRGLVAGAAALAATLALSGCSDGTAPSTSLAHGAVPQESVTLTVWSFLPGNYEHGTEAYAAVFDAFTAKYPQVKINLVDMPYPSYFDQIRNATVSRSGPDVVTMYGGAQAYSYKDGLFPLQDAMDPELTDELRYVADNYSTDGNLYAIPTGAFGYTVLANQDLLAKAGLDASSLADWPSLLDSCKKLNAAGIQPFGSGWQDGYQLGTLLYMISTQLMDAATLDRWAAGDLAVDDPLFRTAMDRALELVNGGCFGGEEALGRAMWDDSFNEYYSGQAAMLLASGLDVAETGYSSQPSTIVLPLAQVPESKWDSIVDAGAEAGWSVTRWTAHPEASAALVNFLAGPEAQKIVWEKAFVPPNNSAVDVQPATPMQKEYLPLIANPNNHTVSAAFPLTVLSVMERNAVPLISGTMTEDEFFDQLSRADTKK